MLWTSVENWSLKMQFEGPWMSLKSPWISISKDSGNPVQVRTLNWKLSMETWQQQLTTGSNVSVWCKCIADTRWIKTNINNYVIMAMVASSKLYWVTFDTDYCWLNGLRASIVFCCLFSYTPCFKKQAPYIFNPSVGKGVMFWGCLSAVSISPFVRTDLVTTVSRWNLQKIFSGPYGWPD